MKRWSRRWIPAALGLWLGGCCHPVATEVDRMVCDLAARPRDLQPLPPTPRPTMPPAPDGDVKPARYQPSRLEPGPLQLPPELPGASVPPIRLPELKPGNEKQREEALDKLFRPVPSVDDDIPAAPGPEGRPLTLSDLQRLAMSNSPTLKQAAADVEAARGAVVQAGLYPNPEFGYEGDTMGTNGGPGYQGGYLQQTIKTANKIQLAQAAAAMDLRNAELALRKSEADVSQQVRANYFAVLTARESMVLGQALAKFTTDVYQLQVDLVRKGGFAAPYEPLQLRVLAVQARGLQVQARNRYLSAWKQLAAAMGIPGMPPTEVAGRVDDPYPVYRYDAVLAHVLRANTDVVTAENTLRKARLVLDLARVTPVPDVTVRAMLQKDYTAPPNVINPSLQVGFPIPVWDCNQGNIRQAEGQLVRASESLHAARTDLTRRLAEAFERYENSRTLLGFYRDEILPDQVRVYRSLYERYRTEPAGKDTNPPTFDDVMTAQQLLAGNITAYVVTLGTLWSAIADVAALLQTDDLFQVAPDCPVGVEAAKLPDLADVLRLPCCHPCSPLPDARLREGADPVWSPGVPHTPKPGELPSPQPKPRRLPEVDPQLLEPPPPMPRTSR